MTPYFVGRSLSQVALMMFCTTFIVYANADEPVKDPPVDKKIDTPLPEPVGLTKISKDFPVWVDMKRKLVAADGQVCLTEGQLELFACPKGTKEHEACVSINSDAKTIHAALLAVGAKAGSPVQYDPVYVPAKGTTVEIKLLWTDKNGQRHETRAQEWIRNVKTKKEMDAIWVFAGSAFWTDEKEGKRYYHADNGDLVCVSNFPYAMLDLSVKSSMENNDLLFEAFTEHMPPRGTKVRMILTPKLTDETGEAKSK